jgi:hypothetical protein
MKTYKLRFFFDGVSGTCLWSGNATANEKYGYPIFVEDLPLPEFVVTAAAALVKRYSTFAAQDSHWPANDSVEQFRIDASRLLETFRQNLPADFEVVDESQMTRQ